MFHRYFIPVRRINRVPTHLQNQVIQTGRCPEFLGTKTLLAFKRTYKSILRNKTKSFNFFVNFVLVLFWGFFGEGVLGFVCCVCVFVVARKFIKTVTLIYLWPGIRPFVSVFFLQDGLQVEFRHIGGDLHFYRGSSALF